MPQALFFDCAGRSYKNALPKQKTAMIQDPLIRTQVAALYKEGWDVKEIAEEVGLSLADVIEYCNKLV